MAETIAQKEVCSKCGAEVREGTAFCFACGGRVARDAEPEATSVSSAHVSKGHADTDHKQAAQAASRSSDAVREETNGAAADVDAKTKAALDDLAEKMRADDPAPAKDEKLAKAASERKTARVNKAKSREFVWEPRDDSPVGLLIAAVVILVIGVFVVLFTTVWK